MKEIKNATQQDVDLVNDLFPPSKGIDVGLGIHVVVPADWQTRIANGEDIPGCTYAKIKSDGALSISQAIIDKLNDANIPAKNKGKAAAMVTKLTDAPVVNNPLPGA